MPMRGQSSAGSGGFPCHRFGTGHNRHPMNIGRDIRQLFGTRSCSDVFSLDRESKPYKIAVQALILADSLEPFLIGKNAGVAQW